MALLVKTAIMPKFTLMSVLTHACLNLDIQQHVTNFLGPQFARGCRQRPVLSSTLDSHNLNIQNFKFDSQTLISTYIIMYDLILLQRFHTPGFRFCLLDQTLQIRCAGNQYIQRAERLLLRLSMQNAQGAEVVEAYRGVQGNSRAGGHIRRCTGPESSAQG